MNYPMLWYNFAHDLSSTLFFAKSIQDSIYKEQGLLISSLDCRDIDGRVLIGFRGVSFALYTLKISRVLMFARTRIQSHADMPRSIRLLIIKGICQRSGKNAWES